MYIVYLKVTSAVKYSRSVCVASNSKVVRLIGNKFSNINLNLGILLEFNIVNVPSEYKFRSEDVVKKECRIAIEQKKLSRRNDVNSKNFITHYAKSFNANNKVKRACDPYR